MIVANNATDAFEQILYSLKTIGIKTSPRNFSTLELINCHIEIKNPKDNIINSKIRKPNLNYLNGELDWYWSGKSDLPSIAKYSKFWNKLYSNPNEEYVNSAYGYRIMDNSYFTNKGSFNQLKWVINELKNDNNSRRTVINIKLPQNMEERKGINDIPCTIALQFFVRNKKLICITTMRSNDIIYGFMYDVVFFTQIQIYIAKALKLKIGSYFHNVGSMHIYERYFNLLKECDK